MLRIILVSSFYCQRVTESDLALLMFWLHQITNELPCSMYTLFTRYACYTDHVWQKPWLHKSDFEATKSYNSNRINNNICTRKNSEAILHRLRGDWEWFIKHELKCAKRKSDEVCHDQSASWFVATDNITRTNGNTHKSICTSKVSLKCHHCSWSPEGWTPALASCSLRLYILI